MVKVISKGRCAQVQQGDIDELRSHGLGWFAYSQARLTRNHSEAFAHLTRFRRPPQELN